MRQRRGIEREQVRVSIMVVVVVVAVAVAGLDEPQTLLSQMYTSPGLANVPHW